MKAATLKTAFLAVLGVLDANDILHYMHLQTHTDTSSPAQSSPLAVNVNLARIVPVDKNSKAFENPDDPYLMIFSILAPKTPITPVTPSEHPILAFQICSKIDAHKVTRIPEKNHEQYKLKVSDGDSVLASRNKKGDKDIDKPCLRSEKSGDVIKSGTHNIIKNHFSVDRSVEFPTKRNNFVQILKHCPLTNVHGYDIGWELSRSSIEGLKQSKKLTEHSAGSMLDLDVLITTTGGVYSIKWSSIPILYLGDIEDLGTSQMGQTYITEDDLEDVEVEFSGRVNPGQKVEIFLGKTVIRIPQNIYKTFTSFLETQGFKKQGDYYGSDCKDISNFQNNFRLAPMRLHFNGKRGFIIRKYLRLEKNTCFLDILPSLNDKWLIGDALFSSNSIVIDTRERKRKYKFIQTQ